MTSRAYRPDPLAMTLGADYADAVKPADFPQGIIRYRNVQDAGQVLIRRLLPAKRLV